SRIAQSFCARAYDHAPFLCRSGKGAAYKKAVQSRVKIKRLTAAEVTSYVVTGEPMDKAGAYAVQGIGAFMVEKIEGSYTNVVGLPLSELIGAMQAVDIIRPRVAGSG
ncbi:MAG: Maf family protein, partial [Deltaproteobacteria bacterium]|nr:Maf family protein [Deltaproteobacteria bacterium]